MSSHFLEHYKVYIRCSHIQQFDGKLKRALPIIVKRESSTCCSARSEAVKAINEGLDELVELLEKLSEDSTMTPETRSGAEQLQACVLQFHFIVLLQLWNTILGKIDRV